MTGLAHRPDVGFLERKVEAISYRFDVVNLGGDSAAAHTVGIGSQDTGSEPLPCRATVEAGVGPISSVFNIRLALVRGASAAAGQGGAARRGAGLQRGSWHITEQACSG